MPTRLATANVRVTLDHFEAAHALAEVLALNPDVGGLQEWPTGRDQLLKAATAYDYARNDMGGGPVFWRRDRFGLVRCRAVVLARRSFVGHLTGRKSTLPASVATLAILCDDETGGEVAIINFHLTAEVQSGGRYRRDKAHRARVRRHKREVRRLARMGRRQRRKRPVYLHGDTNYDGLQIPGFVSCWEGRDGGTLGRRAVDVVYASRPAKAVRTVTTGSDHRAVVCDY